ncbi:exported hypothetical protein [metagenome]|uniref:DUF306 domain-containing protein n=1 Tax=metagenome TaxID=256318 RepID=A0A2P2CDV5_9ZZZZ
MSRPRPPYRVAAYAALTAVLLLAGAACGGADDGPDAGDDPGSSTLDGDWTLSSATGLALDDAHPITLTLDGDQVSGTSACNRYLGSVTVSGDTVTFGPLGGTEMACSPPSVMRLEQDFLAALQAADSATVDGDTLTLTGPDSTLTFRTTAPVVDAELVGTVWLLESLVDGGGNDGSVSSVTGDPATLELADDGTITGSTGVNSLTGSWTDDTGGLTITDVGSTLIGSTGARARQEAHILTVLGDQPTASVEGDVLTLTTGSGKGLVYRQR